MSMTTHTLKFSHPLCELFWMNGFTEQYLFPLAYKYIGATTIHDKTEYSDPTHYDEIKNRLYTFIFECTPLLSILKRHKASQEQSYNIVNQYFFNRTNFNISDICENIALREELFVYSQPT